MNNSDVYHPFHIHISPFFVEEVRKHLERQYGAKMLYAVSRATVPKVTVIVGGSIGWAGNGVS